jgi:DNA-binding CsgD family transcriptional regulator
MPPKSKIITTMTPLEFIEQNWRDIVVPLAVFIFSMIASFQLKRLALNRFSKWVKEKKWPAETILFQPIKRPFAILCIVLSLYLGMMASTIPDNWGNLAGNTLWTLFIFILVLAAFDMLKELILFFSKRWDLPGVIPKIRNVISIIIIVISVLVVLSIWGVPTGPLLILIAVAAILALLALRDAAPNFFAGFQLVSWQHIKEGDSIKLENGEVGQITKIGWNNTQLKTLSGEVSIIPNSQLTKQRIIKIEAPLKTVQDTDLSSKLSGREIEIAGLVSQGATNKEIAQKLFITENTAKVHVKNILRKLTLKNRQQLAVYTASKEGVKPPTDTVK